MANKNTNDGNDREWLHQVLVRIEDHVRFMRRHVAESEQRWDENQRRWDKNDRRWEKNDKRWAANQKLLLHILAEIRSLKTRR